MFEILEDLPYVLNPHLNTHADIFSRAKRQNFDLSLHLQEFFVYRSSVRSGESAHLRSGESAQIGLTMQQVPKSHKLALK